LKILESKHTYLLQKYSLKAGLHRIFFRLKALFVYLFEANSPAPEENKETKLFARKKFDANAP